MFKIFFLGFLALLTLVLRFLSLPPQKPDLAKRIGEKVTILTTLSTEPQVFSQSQRFKIEREIDVITERYPEYHYGEKLKISGVLQQKKEDFSNQSKLLLTVKRTNLELVFPQIEHLEKGQGNLILKATILLRQKLVSNYHEFLPEPASGLLAGIVLGVKTQMGVDFKESLRQTGLTHVIVASGLNVTLVAGFLESFLILFLRRQLTLPFIFLGVTLYALLAGFEAPIIRAALMAFLALAAQAFGRQNWGVLTLFLTGFLMLLAQPLLLFDLGFQLSFLATAGLILVKPILEKTSGIAFLAQIPLIGGGLTTTLSAQLATLPPILANFGSYFFLSLLTNALVLWSVPWIMGGGVLVGIAGLIFKPAGQLLAFLVYPFLFYFEKITLFFAKIDLFSLQISHFPFFFSLAYFSFLVAFLFYLKKRGQKDGKMG